MYTVERGTTPHIAFSTIQVAFRKMAENGSDEFISHSSSSVPPSSHLMNHSYSPSAPQPSSYSSFDEGSEDLKGNLRGVDYENKGDEESEAEEDEDENNYSESFEEESVVENDKKTEENQNASSIPPSQFKSPKIYESKTEFSSRMILNLV
jgi:hypothetical protein